MLDIIQRCGILSFQFAARRWWMGLVAEHELVLFKALRCGQDPQIQSRSVDFGQIHHLCSGVGLLTTCDDNPSIKPQ
jgi:hypothetical protein